MGNFFEVITMGDIVFALAVSLILTYLIRKMKGGFRFVGVYGDIKINYSGKNIGSVIKSCCELFPRDMITFQGSTFKRGSRVQIITSAHHKITGELIGANSDNMICLITSKHIVAHELAHILEITAVEASLGQDGSDGGN